MCTRRSDPWLLVENMNPEIADIGRQSLGPNLPGLIARTGQQAATRFLELFTVNIRNVNTRAAYGGLPGRSRVRARVPSYKS